MKNIIFTLHVYFTLLLSVAFAEKDPTWKELNELFGMDINSNKVINFVQSYNLKKGRKFDSGWFFPEHNSFTIMYDKNRITTIILEVTRLPQEGDPTWRTFNGDLPSNIKPSSRYRDLISLLGEPQTKRGESWILDGLNISVDFNRDGAIRSLSVSKADPKQIRKEAQQAAPRNR